LFYLNLVDLVFGTKNDDLGAEIGNKGNGERGRRGVRYGEYRVIRPYCV
jgi:hypothetical protein